MDLIDWWVRLDWTRLFPELLGKFLGFAFGFAASWYLLFRKRLKALERLKQGDSDDVLFQAHHLLPIDHSEDHLLLLRSIAAPTTLDRLYDNTAARDMVRELADKTTLEDPILRTTGTTGFEVLNDVFNHLAGQLASTPFRRETWLFALTCEDRQVVRRKCVRCFLIRPEDLKRFGDWTWCREHVRCEQPWHWYRIVALHQIACAWQREEAEEKGRDPGRRGVPLIDDQASHRRVRKMSAGVFSEEIPIGDPVCIPWEEMEAELQKLTLDTQAAGEAPPLLGVIPG